MPNSLKITNTGVHVEEFLKLLFTPINAIDQISEINNRETSPFSHWIWLAFYSAISLIILWLLWAVLAYLLSQSLVKLTTKIHDWADAQSNLSQMRNNAVAARGHYRVAGWFHQKSGFTTAYQSDSSPTTAAPWIQKTSGDKSKYSRKLIRWLWLFTSSVLDLKGGILTVLKSPYAWYILLGSLWVVQRDLSSPTFSTPGTISIPTLATILTILTFVFTFFFTVSRRARTQFLTEKLKQAENSLHAVGQHADNAHSELEEFTNAIYRRLPSLSNQLVQEATDGKLYVLDGVVHSSPSSNSSTIASSNYRETEHLNDVFANYPELKMVAQSFKKIERELEEVANFKFLARQCPPPAWSLIMTAKRESMKSQLPSGACTSESPTERFPGLWSALQDVSKDALLFKYEETQSRIQNIWGNEHSEQSISKIQNRLNQWLKLLREEIRDLCELEVELKECARSINQATTLRGLSGLRHSFSR